MRMKKDGRGKDRSKDENRRKDENIKLYLK
jgi:hypothetical protein